MKKRLKNILIGSTLAVISILPVRDSKYSNEEVVLNNLIKKSGYTLPKDMQTVSQEGLDSSFVFENEWNNYVDSKYDAKKSKSLLDKMRDMRIKNSSEDYLKEVENVDTVEETMSMLMGMKYKKDSIVFGKKDFSASVKTVHKNQEDDCDGGSVYSIGVLSDNGFPPYRLRLEGEKYVKTKDRYEFKDIAHSLFIYKTDKGNFGTLGMNKQDNLYPRYNSIESLVDKISENMKINFTEYSIYDLKKSFPDFMDNEKDNTPANIYLNPRSICGE